MKKRLLALILTAALTLTLLPATATAEASTWEVGGTTYALTEEGLRDAIGAASDGDTIKFMAGGTITLSANININKSITLDLNGQTVGLNSSSGFSYLSIPNGYSVTVRGPGTVTTNTYIYVYNTATLTVQGDAVVEGTGTWQTLMNYGTVSMTGGALRQTNGNFVLQNSGAATFENVTIETSNGRGSVIWAAGGTLTLNNCTTRNNFSGTMTGTLPSVILVSNSAAVTLNSGSVIAPAEQTLPAIEANINTTFTNNGATITNGYVKKLGDLSVSVSSGVGKVTLAPQTEETGVTYYYKKTAADDSAAKPVSYASAAFTSAGWTAFSAVTDITTVGTAVVYVQVVKVGDNEQKIYGWGQGSATPEPAPKTPETIHTTTVYNDPIKSNANIWLSGSGLSGNDLLLTKTITGGSDYNTLLTLADQGDILGLYEISLQSGRKSSVSGMYLTFDIGRDYAGQTLTLVHKKVDGTLEYFYATANADGNAKFGPLYELSPFMLVNGRMLYTPDYALTDVPKTGDNSGSLTLTLITLAVIIGMGAAAYRKRHVSLD